MLKFVLVFAALTVATAAGAQEGTLQTVETVNFASSVSPEWESSESGETLVATGKIEKRTRVLLKVVLPLGTFVHHAVGFASNAETASDFGACPVGGDCPIGWSAFLGQAQSYYYADRIEVLWLFENWSHDHARYAKIVVYHSERD